MPETLNPATARRRLRARGPAALAIAVLGVLPLAAATPSGAAVGTGPDAAGVTWLCRPGLPGDPCLSPESATSVAAGGTKTVVPLRPAANPKFDCFYIYPTVTASAAGTNTGTRVTAAEQGAAVSQASQFSQVCNVWAPTYRQRTAASLALGLGNDPSADLVSYDSLLKGWKDYLTHDNHGRPIILLGHSQGAANAIRLLRGVFDNDPALRSRLVVAMIMGGNVQVPTGMTVGGSFAHIPACTSGPVRPAASSPTRRSRGRRRPIAVRSPRRPGSASSRTSGCRRTSRCSAPIRPTSVARPPRA